MHSPSGTTINMVSGLGIFSICIGGGSGGTGGGEDVYNSDFFKQPKVFR